VIYASTVIKNWLQKLILKNVHLQVSKPASLTKASSIWHFWAAIEVLLALFNKKMRGYFKCVRPNLL